MAFVLDNSVLSGILLGSQTTDYTRGIEARLPRERVLAPGLLLLECTNVLRSLCKRQRLVAAMAQQVIARLPDLNIEFDDTTPAPAKVLDLALRYDLSSYDAAYLDLALRHSLPIATQDAELANAARVAGVGVMDPDSLFPN